MIALGPSLRALDVHAETSFLAPSVNPLPAAQRHMLLNTGEMLPGIPPGGLRYPSGLLGGFFESPHDSVSIQARALRPAPDLCLGGVRVSSPIVCSRLARWVMGTLTISIVYTGTIVNMEMNKNYTSLAFLFLVP